MKIGDRIRQRRVAMRLSQSELAALCGWDSQGRISHYENGLRAIKLDDVKTIASALNISPVWLQYGANITPSSTANFETPPDADTDIDMEYFNEKSISAKTIRLPIVDWSTIKILRTNTMREYVKDNMKTFDLPASMAHAKCVIIPFTGDAMMGGLQNFSKEDFLLVDLDRQPENGNFVIADVPDFPAAIFRQYIIEGGLAYLKALNSAYPTIEVTKNVRICGVGIKKVRYDDII